MFYSLKYVENMSRIIINEKKIFKSIRVIKFSIIETTSVRKFSMHVDNFVRTSRIMMHLTNLSPVKFIQVFDDKVEIVQQNPQIFPQAKKDTRMSSIAIRRVSLRTQIKWTNRSHPKEREREREDQYTRPNNERKAVVFNELLIRGLCDSEFLFEAKQSRLNRIS